MSSYNTGPASSRSDAIIAFDAKNGQIQWTDLVQSLNLGPIWQAK
jgi:hypothetical protein